MIYIVALLIVVTLLVAKGLIWASKMRHEIRMVSANSRHGGYIYFFRGRGEAFWRIKIGRATDPVARLKAHKTANAFGVSVLAVIRVADDVQAERHIHSRFADQRIQREWFTLNLDLWLYMLLIQDRQLTREVDQCLRSGRSYKTCGQTRLRSASSTARTGRKPKSA